jgi:EAL domain-containing protein (putative c-di-GMP-specific phosphodiesterase class I)
LRRDELELFYQPIVELETRRVRALEALVRWRHPQRGLLPPGAFVSIAEETGLIHQIGHWALAEACAQARRWQDSGYPAVPISVNLSARQFRERDFADAVRAILLRTGLAPRFLEIEVTEHTLIEQFDNASGQLDALAALGVQIAIDDFGVGYSSLSYLKRFAIDRVKIDRSFVRNIPGDADGAAITAAIISMSKSLKLRVVAEGVENEQQLEFLAAHGCDEVQGYLFCRPAPASQAALLFGAHGALGTA